MKTPENPTLHRVLVVDDEEIVLVALRDVLQHEGYAVTTASNGMEALDHLREKTFSAIITDQQMPMLAGLEFLNQAKQIQPNATRILITAVLSLNTVIDAINKGEIFRFIIKPWIHEELITTVKNAVQRYELICKNAELQAATLAMNEKLAGVNLELEKRLDQIAQQNSQLEQLNRALEGNLQHSVELCLKTMQTFYPSLGSQARRVYELCKPMAGLLDLPKEKRQTLEISAWLHDIGLVGVPRQLIRRWEQTPETLSEAEQALVKQHPILGQELASFAHNLDEVGPVIRAHHERFDGTGYPDGLAGENIPWLARLLAVAVAYAESNHDKETTAEVIRMQAGKAFDYDAVEVFFRCLPRAVVSRKEREVFMSDLEPGMVLAKGVYTANGLLLIPDGQRLTETFIAKLRNHDRINPIAQSLLVYC